MPKKFWFPKPAVRVWHAKALAMGILAGIVGSLFAYAGFGLLARALPIGARSESSAFDRTLFLVALAIAVVAVALVVLVPAASAEPALWRSSSGPLRQSFRRAERQLLTRLTLSREQ